MKFLEQELSYCLSASVPDHIKEKIAAERDYICKAYGINCSIPNDLVLALFQQYHSNEQHLLKMLNSLLREAAPFCMQYRNFRMVPSHTIEYQPVDSKSWKAVAKILSANAAKLFLKTNLQKPYIITNPTMILANRIDSRKFGFAKQEYLHKIANLQFVVDELILTVQDKAQNKRSVVQTLSLKPIPKTTLNLLFP